MKIKIFQERDIDVLEHKLNKFDDEHTVKFTQSSSAAEEGKGVTVTAVVFYE